VRDRSLQTTTDSTGDTHSRFVEAVNRIPLACAFVEIAHQMLIWHTLSGAYAQMALSKISCLSDIRSYIA